MRLPSDFPFLSSPGGRGGAPAARQRRWEGEGGIGTPVKNEAGFTLVEILVVLVILGLLAGLVGPQVLKYLGGSRVSAARLQVEQLASALDLYRLDMRRYPTGDQGLKALVDPPSGMPAGWNGPYLAKGAVPLDPWGNPYGYRSPGQHGSYDLWSLGADGREGGSGEDADVVSWQK